MKRKKANKLRRNSLIIIQKMLITEPVGKNGIYLYPIVKCSSQEDN